MAVDLDSLSFTELIQLQTQLGEALRRRFEKPLALCFTDVVGSTTYFARFGDAAGRGLQQRHLDLLAHALPLGAGRIVDTAGDGAFTVFPKAEGAAEALVALLGAISAQNTRFPREHQLLIRAGLHFGPVLTDGTAVSGDAVNVAARVCSSATPAEIRLTEPAFRELLSARRLLCRGLGPQQLKGMLEPMYLMSLDWRDKTRFPARVRIAETGEEFVLPPQDTITFGRLREQNGIVANDVVLQHREREQGLRISRWHFELRRHPDGFVLRAVSDQGTEVDGKDVPKGEERPIKPDSKVRLANAMTLEFLPEAPRAMDESSVTTGYKR